MSMLSPSSLRWWYTLRYHRWSQLFHRAAKPLRQRMVLWGNRPSSDGARGNNVNDNLADIQRILDRRLRSRRARSTDPQSLAADIGRRRFTFLNQRVDITDRSAWTGQQVVDQPLLWQFHLHYQNYLLDLLATDDIVAGSDGRALAWNLVDEWIEAFPLRRGNLRAAWHPFCLSQRIVNWILLWSDTLPPEHQRDRVLDSLFFQTHILLSQLEWDLRGNHLLVNLGAVAVASAFFSPEDRHPFVQSLERYLPGQLAEQILPWGEHFERSPMYHAQMLELVTDMADALALSSPALARLSSDYAQRMTTFLTAICHPDGNIPLFGDSAFDETPPLTITCCPSAPSDRSARAEAIGDYWVFRDGESFLIFDAGKVAPDELPAHGHCDLLGWEASWNGARLFVDSGVFDYEDSPLRRYCRSTAAHNVLQVDGAEQCDIWSRFRMGYRGRSTPLEHGGKGGLEWCRATHDAYRHLSVPETGRWIGCCQGGPWIIVGWAHGQGAHHIVDRLHLHSDVQLLHASESCASLHTPGGQVFVYAFGPGVLSTARGHYCPEFGNAFDNLVLAQHLSEPLPAAVGWLVSNSELAAERMPRLRVEHPRIWLDFDDHSHQIR